MSSYDPPDWVKRGKGAAANDFGKAARAEEAAPTRVAEPRSEQPRLELEMKGPDGEAARKEARQQVEALRRAEQARAAALGKQAQERQAGAAKQAKEATSGNDVRKAAQTAKDGIQIEDNAKTAQVREQALSRAAKAREFAENARDVTRSKENER